MTQAQLNQLTLEQLRTLNEQVVKIMKIKRKQHIPPVAKLYIRRHFGRWKFQSEK